MFPVVGSRQDYFVAFLFFVYEYDVLVRAIRRASARAKCRCKRRRIELCYRCSPYGILPRVKTRDVPTAPLIILNKRLQVCELGPEAFTALLGVATDPHPVFYLVLKVGVRVLH